MVTAASTSHPQPVPATWRSLGAFVEVFRDFTLVAAEDVAARAISQLRRQGDAVLAYCTSPRARQFGVTAAIHSTPDYSDTHAWAEALHEAGFDGVRHFCSHDPSQREIGIAVFGDAGEADWPGG